MDRHSVSPCETLAEQYQALLEVTESISVHRDLTELCQDLAQRLHRVVNFEHMRLLLYDQERHTMRLHVLETPQAGELPPCSELSVDESPGGWVWQTQQPLVIPRVEGETRFPKVTPCMLELGVKSFCAVPLTTAQRRLGALGFGSLQETAYDDADLEFLHQVARQVAVAVDNVLNYESVQSAQRQLAHESDRLRLLLEVNNAVVSRLDLRDVFAATAASLRRVIPHALASLYLYDPDKEVVSRHALDSPSGKGLLQEGFVGPIDSTPAGPAIRTGKPALFEEDDLKRLQSDVARLLLAEGVKSGCCVPLTSHNRLLGTLNIASLRPGAFSQDDVDLLSQVANQIAIAVENALAFREIEDLKNKLAEEKLYLEDEIRTEYNFEEIVGESAALKRILKQVETVAPTDSTVLIHGETGTGKELIARAIHNLSKRRERTFVKMNCAAIPTGLLESELFGHERGAFTGAIAQKVGRFELAHGGTLFLDEVGDIPLELQSKMLRVLQDRTYEMLGSSVTRVVDVRVISATNRNLQEMVSRGQFREDLLYRLNLIAVQLPSLRERPGDLPLIVRHFLGRIGQSYEIPDLSISVPAINWLQGLPLPGNIRQLRHLLERAVLVTAKRRLEKEDLIQTLEMETNEGSREVLPQVGSMTLDEIEKAMIQKAMKHHGGNVSRVADALGMSRAALYRRFEKYGISA